MAAEFNDILGPNPNNPAGRLLIFIREVEIAIQVPVTDLERIDGLSDGSSLSRFAFIFGLSPHRIGEVHRLLGVILDLPGQLVAAGQDDDTWQNSIRETARQADDYLRVITSNLRDPGLYAPPDGLVTSLKFCDTLLSTISREQFIDESTIDDLLLQVDQLLQFVRDAGLDEKLARFLIDGLMRLRTAIAYYKFTGTAPIRDEVDRFFGGLYVDQTKYSEAANSDNGVAVMDRLRSFFSSLLGRVLTDAAAIVAAHQFLLAIGPGPR
jgi:hypothetical protein